MIKAVNTLKALENNEKDNSIKDDLEKKYQEKVSLMKEAVNDKLYMDDLNEVMDDFKYVDSENI